MPNWVYVFSVNRKIVSICNLSKGNKLHWHFYILVEIDEALKYDVIAMPQENVVLAKNDRYSGLDESMTIQEPPTCVLCEFVMTKLENELKNKTEQEDIKRAIESICNRMPKTVAKSCDKFVEQYANAIITLIGSVPPKEICQRMQLCFAGLSEVVTGNNKKT